MSQTNEHTTARSRNRADRRGLRSATGGSGITEFGPSIIVLILVIFPAIDLIGLATGAATMCLMARQCATRASTATSLSGALSAMKQEAGTMTQSGFGQFSRLSPLRGFENSGADLFIKQTNIHTSTVTNHGPNSPLPRPIDTASNIYEAAVNLHYNVGPLLDLSFLPGMQDVPALGKPAELTFVWERALEHPEFFVDDTTVASGSAGGFAGTGGGASSGTGSTSVLGAWNYPTGGGNWQPMPGQKVLQLDDINVAANSEAWLTTDIEVQQGNRLTFDFLSQGFWSDGYKTFNADGDGGATDGSQLPMGCLIGQVGNGPKFFIGVDQWNFTPPSTGKLKLLFNDWDRGDCTTNNSYTASDGTQTSSSSTRSPWEDNSGAQKVRIYRTN